LGIPWSGGGASEVGVQREAPRRGRAGARAEVSGVFQLTTPSVSKHML